VASLPILPKHIWQNVEKLREEAPRITPVGTGPYRLAEWKKAQYLRFVANDKYHRGAPNVKSLFYKIVPDSNVMTMQLRRGEVDVCHIDSSAKHLLANDKSVRVTGSAGQAYTYIALNHAKDVFADKRVRRAMISAFERQAVIDNILDGSAYLAVADLPPTSLVQSADPIAYDADEADRLLTEAGWVRGEDDIREKDGKKLAFRLLVSNKNKRLGDAAIAFRQNMMAVGIAVEIVPMDFTTMRTKHLLTGDYEACLISQRLPIDPLLRAEVWTAGGAGNRMGYHNAKIDALYEKARTANGATRDRLFCEVQNVLLDDMPQLFLWYPAVTIGVRQGIEGIDAAHLGAKDNIFHNAETWTIVR
jgi:peptide/nickel transport system substrate-binding protein